MSDLHKDDPGYPIPPWTVRGGQIVYNNSTTSIVIQDNAPTTDDTMPENLMEHIPEDPQQDV